MGCPMAEKTRVACAFALYVFQVVMVCDASELQDRIDKLGPAGGEVRLEPIEVRYRRYSCS